MFGLKKKTPAPKGPTVDTRMCVSAFKGNYPHVGLLSVTEHQVWVCKPLDGQAIRTSHAALIVGRDSVGSVWKDRFLCFWFYTPGTADDSMQGHALDPAAGHLVIRVDPCWDYDACRLIPEELTDQTADNLARQAAHAREITTFYRNCRLRYPVCVHLVAQRPVDSRFDVARVEPAA